MKYLILNNSAGNGGEYSINRWNTYICTANSKCPVRSCAGLACNRYTVLR